MIIKENENNDFALRLEAILVDNMLDHQPFLSIGGTFGLMVNIIFWILIKTFKLVKQDINTTCRCHEEIVGFARFL